MFSVRGLRLHFPALEPWVVGLSCSPVVLPGLSAWMWDHPVLQLPPCPECSPPGCPSPPLLLVWMNVSSLSPSLLDFHTVRFSVSSGCFLFLNCCCPSFGCARRHSVSTYGFHLGRKSLELFVRPLETSLCWELSGNTQHLEILFLKPSRHPW